MTTTHETIPDLERLISILTRTANEIVRLENKAKILLYESSDNSGYRALMREKAILLSGLADETEELTGLPPQISTLTQERIGSFSFEAERALRLDSVFYMAVLLFPEDHKDGMPNELDSFLAQLTQEFHHHL